MKNSESDQAFFIESDEEEDKDSIRGENDGNDSEYSNSSDDNPHQGKPSSLNPSWPQSYRYILKVLLDQNIFMNLESCFKKFLKVISKFLVKLVMFYHRRSRAKYDWC